MWKPRRLEPLGKARSRLASTVSAQLPDGRTAVSVETLVEEPSPQGIEAPSVCPPRPLHPSLISTAPPTAHLINTDCGGRAKGVRGDGHCCPQRPALASPPAGQRRLRFNTRKRGLSASPSKPGPGVQVRATKVKCARAPRSGR